MKRVRIQTEIKIAALYAIFGGFWILFSDSLLSALIPDLALYARVQTYKGWVFVVASATLIYSLIHAEAAKREEALQKLRASEEALRRFELLSDHSRDMILFMRREDGRILEANAAALQAYRYNRDELLSLTVRELRAPQALNLTAEQMAQADSTGILFETLHRRQDGSTFPVEVSSQGATIGGVRTLVSIVRDITARKQAESALQHTAVELDMRTRELNAILSSVQEFVYLFDCEARFVFANQKLLNLWGLTSEQVTGKTMHDLGYPETVEATLLEGIRQVQATGQSVTSVTHYTSPTGVKGNYENILAPMFDSHGKVSFVAGSSRDVTERKRAEDELFRTLEELKHSNAELEQFAYVASHDLQEPLRGIAGLAQLLQERYQGQLDSRADEYVGLIVESTQRMQTLINDLLAYSRIGRRGQAIRSMPAEAALHATLQNLDAAIQEYGARITNESLPKVRADETQLVQLFQNLIGNAIKFRSERPVRIHVGVEEAGDCWQFSVQDNGIGIEPQYFERIFQVFQRLHTLREYKGTGIGLAICKKIVERHGGKIWVESQASQGSTFYFTLPKGE